jgi:diguanylate cyclase
MKRNIESLIKRDKEVVRQIEQELPVEQISGHSHLQDLTRLIEGYNRLQQFTDDLSSENQRIKTQLVELGRSLELSTRIDIMTGLVNRRDILGKIEQEFSRANRHNRAYSVILADIDDFKKVNDAHGFNSGDEVIVEIANVIRVCIRSEDICARWSGEQFLLLLPETGIEGAQSVAQKICQTVAMTEFRVHKPGIRVTLSLGVSGYSPGQTAFECISKADKALLEAKRAGKNRYEVAPVS